MRGSGRQSGDSSRILGWVIFIVVIAGGPILNAIQSATGVRLPSWALPAIIALLMLVSAAASIGRMVRGNRPASDQLADYTPDAPSNAPMPPFGEGGASIPRFGMPPTPAPPPSYGRPSDQPPMPPTSPAPSYPPASRLPAPMTLPKEVRPPRFEPVISTQAVLIGLGVFALVAGLLAIMFFLP
jgi:hypothetical protein